ncbi:MAG: PhoH family protein [Luteibaculaceae bacterium]
MQEKIITLTGLEPVNVYGPENVNLELIRNYFPEVKIVARGNLVKVSGDVEQVRNFEDKFDLILAHVHKYNFIDSSAIEQLMDDTNLTPFQEKAVDNVIVFGTKGNRVIARTPNQLKMVELIEKNDMLFAVGPAGTGKTYTAVALAVRALKNKNIKRIILTRPAVEAGENLGFLPGDLKEKLDPYLQPLYDALRDMIQPEKLTEYLTNGTIQIAPLAFMRGRTLDNAFVILDESQNATVSQMKMFLTRMGRNAKFVVTGDQTQVDLPSKQKSGLGEVIKLIEKIDGIGLVMLDKSDVIRHPLVKKVIEVFEAYEAKQKERKPS